MRRRFLLLFVPFLLIFAYLLNSGCVLFRREIWVYTSLPKEVIADFVKPLEAGVPEADVKWYQASSDKIQERLDSEVKEGEPKGDLVLAGDPLWYLEQKRKGRLLPHKSDAAKEVPAQFQDPDGAFSTVRMSAMVLAYHSEVPPADIPERWKDLAASKWQRKFSMGNPLDSAASFLTLAQLVRVLGWDYMKGLRKQSVLAEGNSASVIARIERKERVIGAALLENIIKANLRGTPVRPIYPLDGVILIPGPIAILKDTRHPEIAKKVYDWFYSSAAQSVLVRNGMYSPLSRIVSPDKARTWTDVLRDSMPWSPEILAEIYDSREKIQAQYSDIVLH